MAVGSDIATVIQPEANTDYDRTMYTGGSVYGAPSTQVYGEQLAADIYENLNIQNSRRNGTRLPSRFGHS